MPTRGQGDPMPVMKEFYYAVYHSQFKTDAMIVFFFLHQEPLVGSSTCWTQDLLYHSLNVAYYAIDPPLFPI